MPRRQTRQFITFFWGDVHIKNIGREKAFFISPIKAAKDKGLVFSNHTDFNVTPRWRF